MIAQVVQYIMSRYTSLDGSVLPDESSVSQCHSSSQDS